MTGDYAVRYSPNFRRVKISGKMCRLGKFYLECVALKSLCFQRFAAHFAFGTVLATGEASANSSETEHKTAMTCDQHGIDERKCACNAERCEVCDTPRNGEAHCPECGLIHDLEVIPVEFKGTSWALALLAADNAAFGEAL